MNVVWRAWRCPPAPGASMAFLAWHERFSLGQPEIDQQHLKCFELVNHFDDVIQMGLTAELGPILDDLIQVASAHFDHEEQVMASIGFPGLPEHRKMHSELLKQVREMRTRMAAGGHVGTKSVVRFLADWLTNHILREDKEYKPYLRP
jgi:hemerythrin-like metal-binding protein